MKITNDHPSNVILVDETFSIVFMHLLIFKGLI